LPTFLSNTIVLATLAIGGVVASIIDLRTRRVPNVLTLALAAAGLGLAGAGVGRISLAEAVIGGLVGLALMMPGHLLGATGAGDVKLLAALGTLLGPRGTATAFVATAVVGGLIALFVAAQRRRLGHTLGGVMRLVAQPGAGIKEIENPGADNRFAYAPAVAIGAIVASFVS
jgi:prepilin peptidase CpaA